MTPEVNSIDTLANKTFFLHLAFERFGNLRKANVTVNSEAVESRFNHQKKLLDSPELSAITRADASIKSSVLLYCLVSRIGILVPFANLDKVYGMIKDYETSVRPALIQALLDVYEDQVAQSKVELKEQFVAAHFPTVEQMKAKFSMSYSFDSVGAPPKLNEISPEIFAAEMEKTAAKLKDAASEIVLTMRATAHDLVQKLASGLSADKTVDGRGKGLRASQVEHLKEFVNGFAALNVNNDQELQQEMNKLQQIMAGVNIETLRENDNLKVYLGTQIAEISNNLVALAEAKPGRKFRDAPVIEVSDAEYASEIAEEAKQQQ